MGGDIVSDSYDVYIQMDLNFYIEHFKAKVYGGYLTWMEGDFVNSVFCPFREIYSIGARVQYYGFFVDVKHFSNHFVHSTDYHGSSYDFFKNERWYSDVWTEAMTTVNFGYEWEFDIVKGGGS